ncbi:ribonuclease H-like domain-containing protein [Scheffersomyces coipomensis]|uniref:ribonuclease H-like domain-containing protein n=1 Tax=Scheffersomyces coipomensis TaxID=1788519 RepID=UPI00315DB008
MESVESNEDLDFFNNNFKQFIQTSCPGGKDTLFPPIQAITNIPLTKREKSDLLNAPKNKSITIYDLLLTESQLIQNNYPMSLDDEDKVDKGWVETKSFEHEGSHIFALDCEFCQSNSGKVLTRISLINFQGDLVMDLLVKPDEEITDYLTKYSGITEELLKDVTTTLQDIQTKLLAIISDDDILIGHSLESDLNVMKIKHTKIVDTSVIYEHVRGPPSKPSLKWLSNKFLNRAIQTGELNGDGHSSIEDAQACLDLVKLKFTEGKYFGLNVGEMSLFKKISKEFKQDDFKSLFINYSDYKYQEAYNEPIENKVQVEYVNNDDEVVEKFVENFNEDKRFTILTLRELEFNNNDRFNCQIPEHYNGIRDSKSEEEMNELYKTLNQRLTTIYERLPQDSLMIIHSVIGDAKEMIRLQNIRKQFQKLEREGVDVTKLASEDSWDFDKLQELYEATTNAKKSVTFITLKE